jgi:acylphosphatase
VSGADGGRPPGAAASGEHAEEAIAEGGCTAVGGVADVGAAEVTLREAADGDDAPATGELGEERRRGLDLGRRRRPVRGRLAGAVWVRRHEIPEEDAVGEPELRERPLHDRGRRLGRAGAGELALRGEGQAGDAGAAIPRGLADDEHGSVPARLEIADEALAPRPRAAAVAVEVEGGADARCGELGDESLHTARIRPVIRRRLVVHGRVQGVFFRETARRRALAAGLAGWVRNTPDGTVEAVFEGEPDAVERLVEFCREGPRGARVEWLDVAAEDPEGLAGFDVR